MKQNVFSRFHFIVITGFISSHKIIVGVIYIILLSVMPIENIGETRVRIGCLNFDVSLCTEWDSSAMPFRRWTFRGSPFRR